MNKEAKEVDWSKQKPGTIGVIRDGNRVEFIAARNDGACFHSDGLGWVNRHKNGRYHLSGESRQDILLPWESCIAEGHNPDGLTNGQVGEGWRLLNVGELAGPNAEHFRGQWMVNHAMPATREITKAHVSHRVPITKTKRRVPCGPEHFPPGTVVHAGNPLYHSPVGVYSGGIRCPDTGNSYDWTTFLTHTYSDWRRSLDGGKTWLSCYVEVEA